MKRTLAIANRNPRLARKRVPLVNSLRLRIRHLRRERAELQEEVRQLQASVTIYSEVVQRLWPDGRQGAA